MSYNGTTTESAYDQANGWRTSQGPAADPDQITYGYLPSGRLASYDNADSGISASYAYDAAGQRIESLIDDGSLERTITYTYEGLTLLSLQASSDEPESWRIDYLYDEEGSPYAGTYRSPAASMSPILFVIITTDRGDVVELLDQDGDPFAAYRYDEWGDPLGAGGGITTQASNLISAQLAADIASRQVLRYAGYAYDAESGLSYCSARHYDPYSRQFLSKDPADADGEESPYQYCGGEPVGSVDPSGAASDPESASRQQCRQFKRGSVDVRVRFVVHYRIIHRADGVHNAYKFRKYSIRIDRKKGKVNAVSYFNGRVYGCLYYPASGQHRIIPGLWQPRKRTIPDQRFMKNGRTYTFFTGNQMHNTWVLLMSSWEYFTNGEPLARFGITTKFWWKNSGKRLKKESLVNIGFPQYGD